MAAADGALRHLAEGGLLNRLIPLSLLLPWSLPPVSAENSKCLAARAITDRSTRALLLHNPAPKSQRTKKVYHGGGNVAANETGMDWAEVIEKVLSNRSGIPRNCRI